MDSLLKDIRQACLSEEPLLNLEKLVYLLSSDGLTRQEIYDLFLEYQIKNQNSGDWVMIENKFSDHPVDLTLDRLGGWCNEGFILLPNEPINTK